MHRPHCEFHPQAPAAARCAGCGKYICRDCVVEVGARPFCAHCAGKAKPGPERTAGDDGAAPEESAASPRASPRAPSPDVPPRPRTGCASEAGSPVGARVVATCAYHPGVRAVTRCSRCGALICAGCQRTVGGRSICETCLRQSYAERRLPPGGEAPWPARESSLAGAPWKLWPGLAFLPAPFLMSGLLTYMMRQGDEISAGGAQLLVSLLLYSSTLFFAFTAVSRYGPAAEEIGLRRRNLTSSLGLGFIGGAMAYWMAMAGMFLSYALLNRLAWIENWLQGFFDVNVKAASGVDILIFGLIVVIAAPICEEVFFRGYLYPPMRDKLGVWGAVFLNGFLFSLVHFSLLGLLGRTLAGALFCLLYEYNENLYAPITAHFINNFVAFFLPIVAIWSA